MKKMIYCICIVLLFAVNLSGLNISVNAQDVEQETTPVLNTRKYLGNVVYAGHEDGYALNEKIEKDNPHFGWEIGNFYVSGFTRAIDENTDTPIFLKNSGDKVTLSFSLIQDITKLNGKEELSIGEDDGGYDEKFGVERTYFGKGMLITRYTDYQGKKGKPVLYKDYLKGVRNGSDTEIQLCEEGDYEVTLDYQIDVNNDWWNFWEQSSFDYKIAFKFSVRNGNCMLFPRDSSTNNELNNTSFTENGFYLDFAKSRYLDIDVKKEVVKKVSDGLIEDTRFNKPAANGEKYTDEGVYTITATNRYTNQTTTKVIYVGTDDLLKAYATTQLSLSEIKTQLDRGAKINSDGTLQYVSNVTQTESEQSNNYGTIVDIVKDNPVVFIIVLSVFIILAITIVVLIKLRKKQRNHNTNEGSNL